MVAYHLATHPELGRYVGHVPARTRGNRHPVTLLLASSSLPNHVIHEPRTYGTSAMERVLPTMGRYLRSVTSRIACPSQCDTTFSGPPAVVSQ